MRRVVEIEVRRETMKASSCKNHLVGIHHQLAIVSNLLADDLAAPHVVANIPTNLVLSWTTLGKKDLEMKGKCFRIYQNKTNQR